MKKVIIHVLVVGSVDGTIELLEDQKPKLVVDVSRIQDARVRFCFSTVITDCVYLFKHYDKGVYEFVHESTNE